MKGPPPLAQKLNRVPNRVFRWRLVAIQRNMLPFRKLGNRNQGFQCKRLVLNRTLVPRHLQRKRTAFINLIHSVEVGLHSESE